MEAWLVYWWVGDLDAMLASRYGSAQTRIYVKKSYMKAFVNKKRAEGFNVMVRKRELSRREMTNWQYRTISRTPSSQLLSVRAREEID